MYNYYDFYAFIVVLPINNTKVKYYVGKGLIPFSTGHNEHCNIVLWLWLWIVAEEL